MSDAFADHLRAAAPPALREQLRQATLAAWHQKATRAHPGLAITPSRFGTFLGERLTAEALTHPTAWAVEDLYLALGCLEGKAAALAVLERMFAQSRADDEVLQQVRERLLVGPPRRLEQYAGRSALKAWVALVVKRAVIDAARRQKAVEPAGPQTLAGLIRATPELKLVQADAVRRVQQALRAALDELTEKERALLTAHYFEGQSHAALAEQLGSTRSTVASWLERSRVRLLTETRKRLAAQHRLSSGELDSLLEAMGSRFDLSLSALKPR